MSLGRPDRGSVDDKERLFQILTGLYDAINGTRTSITQLEQRIVTVTDASTTINTGTATSSAVAPFDSDREDGGASDGPTPGASPGTNLARVWVSTADPSVPYGVDMGALGAGTLQQTVTGSIATPTAFAGTTGSIPFYAANSQLAQDNANFFYDSGNVRWGFGTTAPSASATATWERSANGPMGHFVHNGNAGTGTQALLLLQTAASATFATAPYAIFSATGINFTPVGAIPASSAYLEHNGGTMAIGAVTGDVVFYSGAGRTEKARVANGGNVSIANLSAGGVVYATATTAVLKIGTSAEVASAITWPTANQVLFSSGTTTAPIGEAGFTFIPGDNLLAIGAGYAQGWFNLGNDGSGTFEEVAAFWSSNVFNLKSLTSGGTVRSMTIDADTATLTLRGNSVDVSGTTGAQIGLLAGVRSTPAILIGATTSVTIGAGATGPNPSASFTGTRLTIDTSVPSIVSTGAAVWDGLKITGAAALTGAGTTLVYNSTTFAIPTLTGNSAGGTVNESATVRILGAPIPSGLSLNFAYSLWVTDLARFDGNGSHVFELPADATANATGTVGRIPCVIGGTTRYLRYYAD